MWKEGKEEKQSTGTNLGLNLPCFGKNLIIYSEAAVDNNPILQKSMQMHARYDICTG
jgi:hypothetical protein